MRSSENRPPVPRLPSPGRRAAMWLALAIGLGALFVLSRPTCPTWSDG